MLIVCAYKYLYMCEHLKGIEDLVNLRMPGLTWGKQEGKHELWMLYEFSINV